MHTSIPDIGPMNKSSSTGFFSYYSVCHYSINKHCAKVNLEDQLI
jgi:hypothetical protein